MTVTLAPQYQLSINTPSDYQPASITNFLEAAAAQIDIYINAKAQLISLSGSLTSAEVSSGGASILVVDTGLLSEIQAGAASALTVLESEYTALLAQVNTYLTSAVNAGTV